MSERIPDGYAELHFQWNLGTDPEPMFTQLGIKFADGIEDRGPVVESALSSCHDVWEVLASTDYTVGPGYGVIGVASGDDIRVDGNGSATGSHASPCVPQNCAFLIKKNTGEGGKRGRGRMFVPGVSRDYVEANGVLTEDGLDALTAAAGAIQVFIGGFSSLDGAVLFHSTAPFTPSALLGLSPDNRCATQRRRMRN